MSEPTKENRNHQHKKARLGRGIGSLLGGNMDPGLTDGLSFDEGAASTARVEEPAVSSPVVEVKESSATKVEAPPLEAASIETQKISESGLAAVSPDEINSSDVSTQVIASHEVEKLATSESAARQDASHQSPGELDSSKVWMVEVHKLQVNPRQPRHHFAKEQLADLAASIKEKGILQPITARRLQGNELEIVAGERRWRAAQLAGLQQVPVLIREVSNQDSLELALIENIQRQELNAIEEAMAFQRLAQEFNMTQSEISQKVGKDRVTIANTLRLLNLIPEVQQLVIDGRISMGHARAILQVVDPKRQLAIARQVGEGKLSVRATEKLATQVAKSDDQATTQAAPPSLAERLVQDLKEDLQKRIGTRVSIDYTSGKGKLSFYFYSNDELNQMVERIKEAWQK